jgi:hypothetical protein
MTAALNQPLFAPLNFLVGTADNGSLLLRAAGWTS